MALNQAVAFRMRWKGRAGLLPCAHLDLKLKGLYLRWKGTDFKRSVERCICNGCGEPVVRTLNTPVSH